MYVDKKLKGVDCVQTLSRLNRMYHGKQTFVLDFVNDPEDILAAFRPYYKTAEMADELESRAQSMHLSTSKYCKVILTQWLDSGKKLKLKEG